MGGDEGTSIERFTAEPGGGFGQHRRFDLAPLLGLTGNTEIDLEGIDFDGGYLWVVGSHSLKRTKPDKDEPNDEVNRGRLATVTAEANRHTLARIALNAAGEPVAREGALVTAKLTGIAGADQLFAAIAIDPLLGRFCDIPSKDNGIDIEGLAVRGDRVFAGMRGPVLRGWAVILEIAVEVSASGSLSMKGGLRKHLVQLGGLGVRDLAIDGKDMYVLAGPTMDLDGPVRLCRWAKALDAAGEAMVWRKQLDRTMELPFGTGADEGRDHAEGLAMLAQAAGPPRAMICYDSPADGRLVKDHPERVLLDVFELPG